MSSLTIVYALEEAPEAFEKSIFLAGPSPRDPSVPSWRPEALRLLEEAGYDGVVFVPEHRSGMWHGDKGAQIEWEDTSLNMTDLLLFWVPRNMETMQAFTTNIEFGRWEDSGKVIFGAPNTAVKNDYLWHYTAKLKIPAATSLENTVRLAVDSIGIGTTRYRGEREVPLHIWQTPSFQQWYTALKKAGNRLDHARVVWTFRVGPQRQIVFIWALHVDILVTSENRHKINEVVIARPDISTVVLYRQAKNLDDSVVVLVREFRSTVSNQRGYVYESASGSSFKPGTDPLATAAAEVQEETGLVIDTSRIVRHESRQMVATMSTHHAHLFSVELTADEVRTLGAQAGHAFGVADDCERTYVEVTTLRDVRQSGNVDWSMLGMIMQVLVS